MCAVKFTLPDRNGGSPLRFFHCSTINKKTNYYPIEYSENLILTQRPSYCMIIQNKSPLFTWHFTKNLLYMQQTLKKILAHLATTTILAIKDD
jgi:hypothetical protein